MTKSDNKKQRQSNAEKTISLGPLKSDEAASDLLKVKPETKEKQENDKTGSKWGKFLLWQRI